MDDLNELLLKVPSTVAVMFYKQQNLHINNQWIDWAVEMLQTGYATENITILAGEDIHCNPFEFIELTDKIFAELHLNETDTEIILRNHCIFLIKQTIQSPDQGKVSDLLAELKQAHINNEYKDNILSDFYMLSEAIEELKEIGQQWYWDDPALTKDNWCSYVLDYFKHWMAQL